MTTSIQQRIASIDFSYGHQLASCLLAAPIGGGLLGVIAAKKGSRGKGFLYGTVAKSIACPVAAGVTSLAPNLSGAAISALLQIFAPILASYYLTRRSS